MLFGKRYPVHRVSYEFFRGQLMSDKLIMHSCDVASCINPAHLNPGTDKENSIDMILKNRSTHGKKNIMHNPVKKEKNRRDLSEIIEKLRN